MFSVSYSSFCNLGIYLFETCVGPSGQDLACGERDRENGPTTYIVYSNSQGQSVCMGIIWPPSAIIRWFLMVPSTMNFTPHSWQPPKYLSSDFHPGGQACTSWILVLMVRARILGMYGYVCHSNHPRKRASTLIHKHKYEYEHEHDIKVEHAWQCFQRFILE